MFNYRIIGLLKRELQEKLLSKTFIIMTIAIPVLMFVLIGVQTLLMSYEGDENTKLELITESNDLTESFRTELDSLPFVKNGYYNFNYQTLSKGRLDSYLKDKKQDLLDEKITGVFFVSDSAKNSKGIDFYSKAPNNATVTQKLSSYFNKVLIDNYFSHKELSDEDLSFARKRVAFTGFKISKDQEIEEEGYGNMILSILFTLLLYFSLIMMGQMTMQSVMEEKSSRVVEVLLSSVSSKELMSAKIFGASFTGLMQMAVWLIPLILVAFTSYFALPAGMDIQITALHIVYLLFNFFLGLITFIGLFVMIGSMFDNAQEAQSAMWPVLMLIMIPFFIALSLTKNPANPLSEISSLLPFASIIVMPARMTLVDVPVWQFVLSIVINIATIMVIFPIAGKVFRIAILRTGKKPKFSEFIKWLKFSN